MKDMRLFWKYLNRFYNRIWKQGMKGMKEWNKKKQREGLLLRRNGLWNGK